MFSGIWRKAKKKNMKKERKFGLKEFPRPLKISELEELEHFYKSCHIYTHGNTQIIKYPILHYFEISIMLYYIIRNTFLLLCKENETKIAINELDIIALIDRDFEILYKQYSKRSTKNFENYYNR